MFVLDFFLPLARRAGLATLPLVLASPAIAADEPETVVPLDTLVVSATRSSQDRMLVPASVSLVALPDLADRQIGDLTAALATLPGVSISTSGARGAQSSIFLRGASSHQVLFFVDGVRMNDRSASYFNFLGGADLAGLDRFEVLRGPQSTLYGSSALGGVILLDTAHGRGEPVNTLTATGGSFGTRGASASTAGAKGAINYSAAFGYGKTENDLARNDFAQWSGAARLEGHVTPDLLVGATVRAQRGDYEETGSRFFPSAADVKADNTLATAYAEWSANPNLRSRLTYGWHARDYRYTDSFGSSPSQNRRDLVDWQTTWSASPQFELVAGANAEWSRYHIADWRTTDRALAGYVSSTTRVAEDVVLTAGLRQDHYRSAGAATTGRAGVAWELNDRHTIVRANYGTGFSAPGSDDRFGVPQWGQLASPGLQPEHSTGWDAGIEQHFADHRIKVGATYFQNRFRDLFDYAIVDFTTFSGRTVNCARAKSDGLELALEARPSQAIAITGNYTLLDAVNLDDHSRLARRPRHTADLDLHLYPAHPWLLGAGVHFVGNRFDGGARMADYTTGRLYARYAVRENLALQGRVENALNKHYEEVLGYAALPRGVYGSVEWKF